MNSAELQTGRVAGRWTSSKAIATCWLISIVALGALVAWILLDGRFADAASTLKTDLRQRVAGSSTAAAPRPQIASRLLALKAVNAVGLGGAIGVFVGLFLGPRPHRRLRSWLLFTVLVAAWLTLFVSWRELAWQGQAIRMNAWLSGFERVAASLREDWPSADGERAELGAFMAYPQGDPSMLLLLAPPEVAPTSVPFSAVERSPPGALRFQLTGNEPGAWLEWHPAGSTPQSFVGGLMADYRLDRATPLGQGWYLARYAGER